MRFLEGRAEEPRKEALTSARMAARSAPKRSFRRLESAAGATLRATGPRLGNPKRARSLTIALGSPGLPRSTAGQVAHHPTAATPSRSPMISQRVRALRTPALTATLLPGTKARRTVPSGTFGPRGDE